MNVYKQSQDKTQSTQSLFCHTHSRRSPCLPWWRWCRARRLLWEFYFVEHGNSMDNRPINYISGIRVWQINFIIANRVFCCRASETRRDFPAQILSMARPFFDDDDEEPSSRRNYRRTSHQPRHIINRDGMLVFLMIVIVVMLVANVIAAFFMRPWLARI